MVAVVRFKRPASSRTTKAAVNVPFEAYACDIVRSAPVAPSPKVHAYETIVPSESVDVEPLNVTGKLT